MSTNHLMIIDNGDLWLSHGTTNDGDVVNVRFFESSSRIGDSRDHRHSLLIRHRTRLIHRAHDIHLTSSRGRQVNEVVGLEINILGKIAMPKKPLEIDWNQFSVTDNEGSSQVSQLL